MRISNFPSDKFSEFHFEIEGSPAYARIKTGYDSYPDKAHFSWLGLVTLKIKDKNENGLPTKEEVEVLKSLEIKITEFLNQSQTVHHIGGITRNGEHDIIYYLEHAKLDPEQAQKFFDSINEVRTIDFFTEKDPEWKCIEAFIK